MTEVEILNTLVEYGDAVLNNMAVYFTIVFGYLATAYFVGEKLSRFQVIIITGMFIAIAGMASTTCVSMVHVWNEMLRNSEMPIALKNVPFFNFHYWHYPTAILLISGILIALYFMWNVRNSADRSADEIGEK